jgi:hypothetical protein
MYIAASTELQQFAGCLLSAIFMRLSKQNSLKTRMNIA